MFDRKYINELINNVFGKQEFHTINTEDIFLMFLFNFYIFLLSLIRL